MHTFILTVELSALAWMLEAKLLGVILAKLLITTLISFISVNFSRICKIVQDQKILCKLFDVMVEVASASWTHGNVALFEIKQAFVTKRMTTGQNQWHPLILIVLLVADWTSELHRGDCALRY